MLTPVFTPPPPPPLGHNPDPMLATQTSLTYSNPVYPHYFADPFVLRVGGEYYAYGTAPPDAAGRHFPILHSADLANWRHIGHAVDPIPSGHNYWAPEVAQGPD